MLTFFTSAAASPNLILASFCGRHDVWYTTRNRLIQGTAGNPPPSVVPQFDNPHSVTSTLIGICAFLIFWGTSSAAVRIWINRRKLGVGDALVVIAVVLSIAYCAVLLTFAKYFRHQWDLPLSWYTVRYMEQLYAQGMLLGPTIFFRKEAIFLMYFEVFQVKPKMRAMIIVGMVFTGLAYWPGIVIESIFCAARPGETWDPLAGAPEAQRCARTIYWGIVQGACAILIDVYIFVLPIPTIVNLQLGTKRKIQTLSVFRMAVMGILASMFAEVYRVRLLTHPEDLIYVQSQQLICVYVFLTSSPSQMHTLMHMRSVVENWVAVIISCMPAFAAFMQVYVSESRIYLSAQSRILSAQGRSSNASKPNSAYCITPRGAQQGRRPDPDFIYATGSYYTLDGLNSKDARDIQLTTLQR